MTPDNPSDPAQSSRFIRLPNGSWVLPSSVTAIRPLPTEKGNLGDLHRARVVVHHNGYTEILLANDDDHAISMADEIATQMNSMCKS